MKINKVNLNGVIAAGGVAKLFNKHQTNSTFLSFSEFNGMSWKRKKCIEFVGYRRQRQSPRQHPLHKNLLFLFRLAPLASLSFTNHPKDNTTPFNQSKTLIDFILLLSLFDWISFVNCFWIKRLNYYNSNYMTIIYKYKFML